MSKNKLDFNITEIIVNELVKYVGECNNQGDLVNREDNETIKSIRESIASKLHNFSTKDNPEVQEFIGNIGCIINNEDLTNNRKKEFITEVCHTFFNNSVTVESALFTSDRENDANMIRRDIIKHVNEDYFNRLSAKKSYTKRMVELEMDELNNNINNNHYDNIFNRHVELVVENSNQSDDLSTVTKGISPEVIKGMHNLSKLEFMSDMILESLFGLQ